MKAFIIKQISKQYKKRVPVAKYLRVQHINHMFQYSYTKLIKTYLKALTL